MSLVVCEQVICIGDEWVIDGTVPLTRFIQERNATIKVLPYSGFGDTSQKLVDNEQIIVDAVKKNKNLQIVWVSVGAIEIRDAILNSTSINAVLDNFGNNMNTIINLILNVNPKLKIVHIAYDFPHFDDKFLNRTRKSVHEINEIFLRLGKALSLISNKSFTYISVWGALQQAAGQKFDLNLPSPLKLMRTDMEPNGEGFGVLMELFYTKYFKSII
jgi:lysophospholipase L1-like esterase